MSVVTGEWRVLRVGDIGWELGEGLRSTERGLVAVDLLAGDLYDIDLQDDIVTRLLAVGVPLGAVAPVRGTTAWIAAVGDGVAHLQDDEVRPLGRLVRSGGPRRRVNDAVCDPRGRFWVGTMAYDNTPRAGALHRVDGDRIVRDVLPDLTIPNGQVFSGDAAVMFVADSAAGLVHRVELAEDGTPTSGGVHVEVPGGSPDGMTLDDEGCLWIAVWGAGQLWRVGPDGTPLEILELPARQPTSVALHAGHVVVSTATHGLASPGEADGHLLVAPCSVAAPTSPSHVRAGSS